MMEDKINKALKYLLERSKEFLNYRNGNPQEPKVLMLDPNSVFDAYVDHVERELKLGTPNIQLVIEFYHFIQDESENYERRVRRNKYDKERKDLETLLS